MRYDYSKTNEIKGEIKKKLITNKIIYIVVILYILLVYSQGPSDGQMWRGFPAPPPTFGHCKHLGEEPSRESSVTQFQFSPLGALVVSAREELKINFFFKLIFNSSLALTTTTSNGENQNYKFKFTAKKQHQR